MDCKSLFKSIDVHGFTVRSITRRERMKIDELIETLPELTSEDKVKKIITIQSEMIRVSTGFNGDCEELPNYVFNALLEAFDKVNTLSEAEKKT